MGQSGRVSRGGQDSGQRGRGSASGRGSHLLPLVPAVPAPEARAPGPSPEPRSLCRAAHSFVFARGRVGRSVHDFSMDLRRVMEPLTATRLQVCIPPSPPSPPWASSFQLRGWLHPRNRWGPQFPRLEKDLYGYHRACLSGL